GVEMGGEVVAGVVFNNYNAVNATAHIAIAKPCKATHQLIRHAFHYAFVECGLKRLTGMVPVSEPKTVAFDQHLGFEPEFIMKSAAFDGGDLQVLVMWPDNCRWLRRN
ncbi:MAG: N-acetyltransferase, partial [Armatimonadia bacterium]